MVWTLEQYKAALKASQDEANRLNLLATSTKQESSAAKAAADKAAAKAAETKSIVELAGYNLKRTQQTAAENAAKANTLAQQQAAQAAAKAKETEAAKRAAEFKTVKSQYELTQAKNPFVYQKGSAGRGYDNSQYNNYLRRAAQEKTEAEKKLRYKNLTADGYDITQKVPPNAGKDAFRTIQKMKNTDARKLGRKYDGYVRVGVARNNLLSGLYGVDEYFKVVGQGIAEANAAKEAQTQRALAKSKASLYGRARAENQQWAEKISNPETYQNQLTGAKIMDVKQAPVNQSRINDPLNNEYSIGGTAVSAKEKSNISDIIARQRAQEEINREQQKLFNAIRNAPNAAAALKLRSAAMAQNPNVGTFNALYRGNELQSTSGVFGIGDGTVKDLNYNKFDRATQTFAENPKLGNLTDSQGNIIASNLKSSSGSEWNFSPVTTPTTAKEESEPKIAQGIPVSPTAAGFLGGLSLFAQSPSTSSSSQVVPSYEFRLEQYENNFDLFNAKWDGVEEFTSQEQADEYAAEYEALNIQYENLSKEFEIQQSEFEEYGDYMKDNERTFGFLPTPNTPNDDVNALIKSGSNLFAGVTNIGIGLGQLTDPIFGTTTPKGLYRDYYSTPVTNIESAVFGAGIGTATQGGTYWTSGQGVSNFDFELQQVGKNFERNPREATGSTILEASLYIPLAPFRIGYSFFKGLSQGGRAAASEAAQGAAKGAAKGSAPTAPKAPTKKQFDDAFEIKQKYEQESILPPNQRTISNTEAKAANLILKEGKGKFPKDPTPNIPTTLKDFDNVVVSKTNKVPKVDVPVVFNRIPKILDDLPVKAPKTKLPVKPKDAPTPIKIPDAIGFPKVPDSTIPKAPDLVPTPKGSSKRGFAFPFGLPLFGGRSGGASTGFSGKPQSKRKFTAWDVRTDKIGFYGFGRKSDSYGGVFGELDELDKVARAEKKTKPKEKKSGIDEVFNFSFEF